MSKYNELTYEELRNLYDPSALSFTTTDQLEPMEDIVGQERAVKAMNFGLQVKMGGYNIYMSGPTGTGKTSYAKKYVSQVAAGEEAPSDWCYVYNFKCPSHPQALEFPSGKGKEFKEDVAELMQRLWIELPKAFRGEQYETEKSDIIKTYQEKSDALLKDIKEHAKELGFSVKVASSGIYFIPIVDGEKISEAAFDELPEDEKDQITQRSDIVQEEAAEAMRLIKELEKEAKKKIEELEYKIGLFAVGHHITELQHKYKDFQRVLQYLQSVQEDILENIQEFIEYEEEEEEEHLASILPFLLKKSNEDISSRYEVNLLVDHSNAQGAPVVVDFNPTFYNLLGKVEYDNEFGNLKTDYTKIKPGLFHQANGGYLILQAHDLLNNIQAWEVLKRVLKTKTITIESLREQLGAVAVSSLKPEPIPVDLKVILIGSSYLYHILNEYDEDFKKLFKIRVDFHDEMPKTNENITMLARFIRAFCEKENISQFEVNAVAKVIEYASRLAEHREKITTRFSQIVEILCEANTWTKIDGQELVTADHVIKAIYEKERRSNLIEIKMDQMLKENILMIDTDGEKIGQINGLAVIDAGDYIFGKPTRITATTYMGKEGIINIEKEADLSGKVHSKGVHVLTGYLGQTYAQSFPLSLSCQLCFEQNYYGVDGDSASSTELYGILSSLAEAPIKQGIAVTGSINQRGEIQPIGGVTYKVEGFFKLCKERGLTGTQGVIIPYQNVKDLILKEEVLEAIKNHQFHIYPVKYINEGMEILTDLSAETIHQQVMNKLEKFYLGSRVTSKKRTKAKIYS